MASQTSASASRQGLPASRIMIPASSSRRLRRIAAAPTRIAARAVGSRWRQAGKAAHARATARRASSAVAPPVTSDTRAARTAWPKASRWLRSAKFLAGSLKKGRPSPKPGIAGLS